jgi:hypothetical protein
MAKSRTVLKQEPRYSKDPLLQKKAENVLSGLEWTAKHLFSELPDDNKPVLVDF